MLSILFLIIESFYFMLPAYFANMAPVIFRKLKFLDIPIDFNKKLNNKPLLGKNKTYRGLVFGISLSIITAFVQYILMRNEFFRDISIIPSDWILFGFCMGFGALLGDSIKSFFKRRASISSGKPWPFFDQIDYVLGSFLITEIFFDIPWDILIMSAVLSVFLTILINHIAYILKIRDEPW